MQGAAALVPHLGSQAAQLQANAAGALQSICYQRRGRASLRGAGLVPKLAALLAAENKKVRARAVGALHNVSSDAEAIRAVRRCAAAPPSRKPAIDAGDGQKCTATERLGVDRCPFQMHMLPISNAQAVH